MKDYALDTSLLPNVWLTWEKADGTRIYMNGKTGKRHTKKAPWMGEAHWNGNKTGVDLGISWYSKNQPNIWVKSGSNLMYSYVKYHKDIERLEVAVVVYDTKRGEYEHEWKFAGERFFIGKDKSCILSDGTTFFNQRKEIYKYQSVWNTLNVLQVITRIVHNNNTINEFCKFLDAKTFTIGNGSEICVDNIYHIQRWYETTQKVRSNGKQQKLTDKLTAIQLSSIEGFGEKYPAKKHKESDYYSTNINGVVYFEKVDDNMCVLRSLNRDTDGSLYEVSRIYIGNDGTTRIVSKSKVGWIPSRQVKHDGWNGYNKTYLANKDDAIAQCPRIKYIMAVLNSEKEYEVIDKLITALRFPEIEQLYKFGLGVVANTISSSYTPKADLKGMFGGYYNDKEKNLLRKIGMTKQQLDTYMRISEPERHNGYIYSEYTDALEEMRKMFGNDLTYLDIASFEKYLVALKEYRRFKSYRGHHIMDDAGLNLDNNRFFKNLVRLMSKRQDIFTVVYDTMRDYRYLRADRRFNIDWYFDDVSDAVRAHDAVVELYRLQNEEDRARYNLQEAERRKKEEEKRKRLDKERQVYEYEDGEYIIRLPKDASEIVSEGSTQHICIGSYVSRHSVGDTNLFFLRRKSEPDKPFYAIEMSNSKNIVQIHGFGNRWLGNNPEAIPTVIRWLRKHDIKCDNEKLTCKATGYGMSGEFVAMPVVD